MKRLMPTGLPGPSSMNSTLASFISTGLPSLADLELDHAGRADDLLGRDAVDLLGPGRMNSTPPPETMKVLKPLARR